MDEQAEARSDQELADSGDLKAQLRVEVSAWIESKGASRCPLCGQEDAWDLAGAENVYPLSFGAVSTITNRNSDLPRIKRAIQGNMRISRLVKLTCGNCRYALLLDHVKMREDAEEGQ